MRSLEAKRCKLQLGEDWTLAVTPDVFSFTEFLNTTDPHCSILEERKYPYSTSSSEKAEDFVNFDYFDAESEEAKDYFFPKAGDKTPADNLRSMESIFETKRRKNIRATGTLVNETNDTDNAMEVNILWLLMMYINHWFTATEMSKLWKLKYQRQAVYRKKKDAENKQILYKADFIICLEAILFKGQQYDDNAEIIYVTQPSPHNHKQAKKNTVVRMVIAGIEDKIYDSIDPAKWTATHFQGCKDAFTAHSSIDATVRLLFPQIAVKYRFGYKCDRWFISDYTNSAYIHFLINKRIYLSPSKSRAHFKRRLAEIVVHALKGYVAKYEQAQSSKPSTSK